MCSDTFLLQERKKAIKEEKRENRKNKIPKHIKKRKEKIAKDHRGTRKWKYNAYHGTLFKCKKDY